MLLERGGPVSPEEEAARLAEVGVRHWTGDLGTVLKRAMAPCPEVAIDGEGRFYLAILDPEDRRLRRRLESLWPPVPQAARSGEQTAKELESLEGRWEEERAAERAEAAGLRRVLLHAVTQRARSRQRRRPQCSLTRCTRRPTMSTTCSATSSAASTIEKRSAISIAPMRSPPMPASRRLGAVAGATGYPRARRR